MSTILSETQSVLQNEMGVETMAPPAPAAVVADYVMEGDVSKSSENVDQGHTLLILGSDPPKTSSVEQPASQSETITHQITCRPEDMANIVILAEASEGRVLEQVTKQEAGSANPPEQSQVSADRAEKEETEALDAPDEATIIDIKPSIAVQANDYEIERSGLLPARRRIIPFKFRDFRDPDTITDDPTDHEYTPPNTLSAGRGKKRPARRAGRLAKQVRRVDHAYERPEGDDAGKEQQVNGDADDVESEVSGEGQTDAAQSSDGDAQGTDEQCEDSLLPRRGRPPKENPAVSRTNNNTFKCYECNKNFSSKGNLKVHMQTHTDLKPFVCNITGCDKAFRTNESLKRHKLAHMGIKLFECEYCKSRFSSNVALKEHIARHTDTKPHSCPICKRDFRQVSCLRRHLTTHSDEQPYKCSVCGRCFSQMVYLRSHMRSHTGERPFPCGQCEKRFRHQSDLQRHQAVHSGVKNYSCEECGARFTDPSSRRRHIREHTGFKPYKCQLCGDYFKRAGQLRIHLIKKHNNFSGILGPVGVDVRTSSIFPHEVGEVEVISIDKVAHVLEVIDEGMNQQAQQEQAEHLHSGDQQQQQQQQQQQIVPGMQQPQIQQNPQQISQAQTVQILSTNQGQVSLDNVNPTTVIATDADGQVTMTIAEDGTSQAVTSGEVAVGNDTSDKEQVLEETRHILEQMRTHILEDMQGPKGESEVDMAVAAEGLLSLPASSGETLITKDSVDHKEQLLEETRHILEQIHTQFESSQDGPVGQVAYQIYQDGEGAPQIVEIQYHPQESNNEETSTAVIEELVETAATSENMLSSAATSSTPDYVTQPDFESQDYYNWLSNFTELCKLVPVPLDVDLFHKISQVTKTLTDVLANPRGILANRENFTTLMGISRELNGIINEHLAFILQNLDANAEV